jgi:hypothetical protein
MRVNYKVNEDLTLVAEADEQTALFETLASMQEVFGDKCCGKCQGYDLRYVVRKDNEDNKYYEIHCQKVGCKAKLAFGCNKKGGGLFPKRFETKDGEKVKVDGKNVVRGKWGWTIWNKEKNIEE